MVTERVGDAPGLVLGRIVAQLVNEAAFAVGEGVGTAADVDAGMVLGLNHPRGPMEWGDAIGAAEVLARLGGLQDEYREERYRPAPVLHARRESRWAAAARATTCWRPACRPIASSRRSPRPPRCSPRPPPPPRTSGAFPSRCSSPGDASASAIRSAPGTWLVGARPRGGRPHRGAGVRRAGGSAAATTWSRAPGRARWRPRCAAGACLIYAQPDALRRTKAVADDPLSRPPNAWRAAVVDPNLDPPLVTPEEPADRPARHPPRRDPPRVRALQHERAARRPPARQPARHGDGRRRGGAEKQRRHPRRLARRPRAQHPDAAGEADLLRVREGRARGDPQPRGRDQHELRLPAASAGRSTTRCSSRSAAGSCPSRRRATSSTRATRSSSPPRCRTC